MLEQLEVVLEGMVKEGEVRVGDVSLVREPARVEWLGRQGVRREHGRGRCLHEVFEVQARRRPQARAVVCGESVLSYQELNERAERVAGSRRGVAGEHGSTVGLIVLLNDV